MRRLHLGARFAAFGWETRTVDGHDVAALADALEVVDHPVVVLAHTTKGHGVSFMQGDYRWHLRVPTGEALARAQLGVGADA